MGKFFPYVFLIGIISLFVFGLYDVLVHFEENKCQMTYMFEQPQYIKIQLPVSIQEDYPYNLFVYGEGAYADTLRNGKFTGIPILFIPGNSGSYKQARSIGSVLLRMAENLSSKIHFDVFTLDFDEELTALYGEYLFKQRDFAAKCLKHIQSLYKKPTTIVIMGHSMGGIVARALLTLDHVDQSLVSVIITEATPHRMPILQIDNSIANFYQMINAANFKDISIVSTSGGHRDYLVRESHTLLTENEDFISTSTQSIPRAWVSTDHLCHVWCKEIVLVTARSLFDLIDKSNNQITSNIKTRRKILTHHFLSNFGARFLRTTVENELLADNFTWITENKYFHFTQEHVKDPFYVIFAHQGKNVVITSNTDSNKWIAKCNATSASGKCTNLINLSTKSILLPPSDNDFLKAAHLSEDELSDSTHIILRVGQSKERVQINTEFSPKSAITHQATTAFNSLYQFIKFENPEKTILNERLKNQLFVNITLSGFDSLLQAFDVQIKAYNCRTAGDITIKYVVPWTYSPTYAVLKNNGEVGMSLRLPLTRPVLSADWPQLHLYAMQDCQYEVIAIFDWVSVLGQFVRFFTTMLPAYIVCQLLMIFSWQSMNYCDASVFPDFSESHFRWAQPYRIIPPSMMLAYFLTFIPPPYSVVTDFEIIKAENIWVNMLPLMLYFVAFAMVAIFSCILNTMLVVVARVLGPLAIRMKKILMFMEILILFSSTIFIFICGSVSILFIYILCYFKCVGFLININYHSSKTENIVSIRNSFNLYFVVFLLAYVQFIFNVPVLLAFAKNPLWFMQMNDLSKYHALLMFITYLILKATKFPDAILDTTSLKVLSAVSYICCIYLVVFCTSSLNRIPLLIDAFLLSLALTAIACTKNGKSKAGKTELGNPKFEKLKGF